MTKNFYISFLFIFTFLGSIHKVYTQIGPGCNCNLFAIQTQSVSCYGQSTGSANATGNFFGPEPECTSSGDPGNYWWTPGNIGTQSISGKPAGVYTVDWSNADGCFETRNVTITQPAAPLSGSITHSNEICNKNNGTVTVSGVAGGTGGYTYSWTFNGNPIAGSSSGLTGCTQGTYACTIKDANNCPLVLSRTVGNTVNAPNGSIAPPTHVTCFGLANGSATASATGGGGAPYTFAWSPSGGNAAIANNLGPGVYTCNITSSNGCTDPTPPTVTINQPAALSINSTGMNPVLCNGGSTGSASVSSISGGTGTYTYSWNTMPVQTGPTANNLAAGFYTCTVRDANNCSKASSSIEVTQPNALSIGATSSSPVLCYGGNTGSASVSLISGGTGTKTFSWSPSGGNAATANNLYANTYACTVTDANGCAAIASNIVVGQPLQPLSANATSITAANCGTATGSASAGAGGGTSPYTYQWSPSGGAGATANNLSAGAYTVNVWDNKGCTTSDGVTIPSSGSLVANANLVSNVSCFGGNNGAANVTVSSGQPPYTYAWSPSGGASSASSTLSANNYNITVTDNAGCVTVKSVTITQPTALTASVSTSPAKCGTNVGTATANPGGGTAGYTYAWIPAAPATKTISNLAAGNYTVTVTDNKGCTKTASGNVISTPSVSATAAATASVTCNGGNNGTAAANVTVGSPPYTYAWTPSGGNTQTATGLAAGNYTVTVTDTYGCTKKPSVTIAQPTAITTTVSVTLTACAVNNGTASVSPSGGTGAFTYTWNTSPVQSASIATGLGVGNYTVTVRDKNNCARTATASITYSTSVTANISSTTSVTCRGGNNGAATATVTAGSSPYTYVWTTTPAQSTQNATGMTAGNYSVNITDNLSCKRTVTVSITQPSAITAVLSTTATPCGQSVGKASAAASGGVGTLKYSWSTTPVQTTSAATGLAAGNYTVTVTDANNCTKKFTALVTNLNAHTVAVSTTSVTCYGGSNANATSTVSGGTSPYTYSWSTGPTTTSVTGLSAGNYFLTVTDASACITSQSFTVSTPPQVLANVDTNAVAICIGSSSTIGANASGGAGSFGYNWAPVTTLNNSTIASPTANPSTATIYTVTVTDKDGCTAAGTVSVSINSLPNVNAGADLTICNGSSASLNANGGINYSWSPVTNLTNSTISNPVATPASPVTYSVTGTDANGCSKTDAINIQLATTPTVSISASASTVCTGTTVTLNASTNGTAYSWSTGQTTASAAVVPGATTTYSVTAFNGSCSKTATITITGLPTPNAVISGNPVLCIGKAQTLTATAGNYLYSWSTTSTASAIVISPTSNTSYSVTVTSASGSSCSDAATFSVTVAPLPVVTTSATYTTICAGLSTSTLTATGGTSYVWSDDAQTIPGGSSIVVSPDALGPNGYTVTVTNGSGCTAISSLTVNVTNGFQVPVVVPNSPLSFCIGDPIPTFSATPNPTTNGIGWFLALPTNTITATGATFLPPQNLTANTYPLYCVQGTGTSCLSQATVRNIVIHPLPTADAGNSVTVCPGYSTQLQGTGGTAYLWTPGTALNNPSISNPTADPELTTEYQVTVIDGNNCRNNDSVTVYVVLNDTCIMQIYNLISPNGDNDNDVWWIDGIKFFPDNNVKIFNRWGAKVWQGKGYDNDKVVWKGDNQSGVMLPVSTYYYIIDLGNRTLAGFVELVE